MTSCNKNYIVICFNRKDGVEDKQYFSTWKEAQQYKDFKLTRRWAYVGDHTIVKVKIITPTEY